MRTSKEILKEIERKYPAKDKYGHVILWASDNLSKLMDEYRQSLIIEERSKDGS